MPLAVITQNTSLARIQIVYESIQTRVAKAQSKVIPRKNSFDSARVYRKKTEVQEWPETDCPLRMACEQTVKIAPVLPLRQTYITHFQIWLAGLACTAY